MLQQILASVSSVSSVAIVQDEAKQALDLTKEELKTLVLKFSELSDPEKQELFDYVKLLQVKDPEIIKWVRNETRGVNL